ncbi:MAG: hypothetical protein ACLS90_03485 [Clostridia bacterium]
MLKNDVNIIISILFSIFSIIAIVIAEIYTLKWKLVAKDRKLYIKRGFIEKEINYSELIEVNVIKHEGTTYSKYGYNHYRIYMFEIKYIDTQKEKIRVIELELKDSETKRKEAREFCNIFLTNDNNENNYDERAFFKVRDSFGEIEQKINEKLDEKKEVEKKEVKIKKIIIIVSIIIFIMMFASVPIIESIQEKMILGGGN